jgi:O-acetyl-ADP-ribose deacetylase (regulator of RNase III)
MNEVSPLLTAAVGAARLDVIVADITTLPADAIVNAANSALRGGGGVDGAIHRAAGPELLAACKRLGGCATGDAKITLGFRLRAKHVIHAVGPIWQGGFAEEERLLESCYSRALALACEYSLSTIAFPAISTGIYGFPAHRAARIAVGTVLGDLSSSPGGIEHVIFCCFSGSSAQCYLDAFADIGIV